MIDIFDARQYIEHFLWIRAKSGELVPLKLKPAQEKLHRALEEQDAAGKPMRAIVLKARQLGFSTYTEARIFQRAATQENHRALVMAHRDDSTDGLFAMFRLFYQELPQPLRPMLARDNDGEMRFANPSRRKRDRDMAPGLRSSIRCATAGTGGGVGRGITIRSAHCSEYAFWRGDKKATLLGVLQAVPAEKGTMVIIESTANGYEEFQKLCALAMAGESDFAFIFSPWYEEAEYRKPVPPGTVWTEKELEMAERFGLDEEQLAWRRWCIDNNCAGDERTFRQEYPSTAEEAFLTTGTGVFDNEVVMDCLKAAPEPLARGDFAYDYDGTAITNIRWVDSERGCIRLYARPEARRPYVLGGDTAGEGSDFFTGTVLDNVTGETVAVLRRQSDEIEYTRQMYCLGVWYNGALMGIEINFSTYPQRELERLGYADFYQRERFDSIRHELRKSYGWRTTPQTRPVLVSGLKDLMQTAPQLVRDRDTLSEMLTFVKTDSGRAEAAAGEHDDLIFSLGIAHQIRTQQRSADWEELEQVQERLGDRLKKQAKKQTRRQTR